MDAITAFILLVTSVIIGVYISSEQAEEERDIEIVQQTTINPLPSTEDTTQSIHIAWWREIYQSELVYNQRYYLSSLSLSAGFRHIIVPYVQGFVKGFNAENGKWEWTLPLTEHISSGVHIDNTLGFVGGEDGLVIAFQQLSGKQQWQTRIDSSVMSINSGKNTLYVYSRRGNVYAISPKTGEIQWSYIGKEPVSNVYGASKVSELGSTVYVGSGGGNLLALNQSNGKLRWQRTIGQPIGFSDLDNLVDIDSGLIVDQNTLYLSTFGNQLHAINPSNQLNYWRQTVPTLYALQKDSIPDSSQQTNFLSVIVVLTQNSHLQAYLAKTGELVWENTQARLRRLSQLTLYQNYWLSIDHTGAIFLFNRQDGQLSHTYQSQVGIAMNPTVKDNTFYWLSQKGQLYAMHLQNRNQPTLVSQPTQ